MISQAIKIKDCVKHGCCLTCFCKKANDNTIKDLSASQWAGSVAISRPHEAITQKNQRREIPGSWPCSWSCPVWLCWGAHRCLDGHLQHLAEPSCCPHMPQSHHHHPSSNLFIRLVDDTTSGSHQQQRDHLQERGEPPGRLVQGQQSPPEHGENQGTGGGLQERVRPAIPGYALTVLRCGWAAPSSWVKTFCRNWEEQEPRPPLCTPSTEAPVRESWPAASPCGTTLPQDPAASFHDAVCQACVAYLINKVDFGLTLNYRKVSENYQEFSLQSADSLQTWKNQWLQPPVHDCRIDLLLRNRSHPRQNRKPLWNC